MSMAVPPADEIPARPSVLWVTDEVPDRALGGGNIRQAHLLEGLGRAADVTLLMVGALSDERVRAAMAQVIELPAVGLPEPRRRASRRMFDLWIAAAGPREVVLTARRRRRLRPLLADLEPRFDIVVVSHLGMAALRPRRTTARWMVQLHHVSSAQAAQERAVTRGRRQRWLLGREERADRRCEARLVRDFDALLLVGSADARLLHVDPASPHVVIAPNGVDTEQYRPTPVPATLNVVMTGSFQYLPNVDGAVWFCDEVWPLVRAVIPTAQLDLVGRQPLPEVQALAERPGVGVYADVPDIAPWLARARVSVVPLRIGTGTRLKALESMAAGRPVVGTSVGLEGLGLEDDVDAHVVDDPAWMADVITRVLTDDAHAEDLAARGRAIVEQRFQWRAIADALARELLSAAR